MAEIYNYNDNSLVSGTSGNDSIKNGGWDNENEVYYVGGLNVTINGGDGDDDIYNIGDSVTISGGAGNDIIYNAIYATYDDLGKNVLFQYASGDGNDKIYGFKSNSTLSIGGGYYSTKKVAMILSSLSATEKFR